MSTVLILGAASDIAVAIARKYAANRFNIQLAARNADRLKTFQSDIQIRYGVECSLIEFDARNFNSHVNFVHELRHIPEVTICVFGYLGENKKALEDPHEASRIIETNYTGAVSILNNIAAVYRRQKQGTIVGISSVAGERGRSSNYMYGSAKAGFTAYLSGLRNDLYHDGVHVVTVLPGFVYTSMTENMKLPPMLTAQPEEVAEAVYTSVANGKNIVYVKWFWRWIMLVITSIPEFIFKKLKL